MASLKIKQSGKTIKELYLEEGKTYTAGRREGAEIFLEFGKTISRDHFIVKFDGIWKVEVLSRFGDLTLSGHKVKSIDLDNNCNFSLGTYDFEFIQNQSESVASLDSQENNQNQNNQSNEVGEESFEKTQVGNVQFAPFIQFLDGSSSDIHLNSGSDWVAGREASNAIVINDQRVSRKQFKIIKESNQYFIIDLGSVNGTLVNSKPIDINVKSPLRSGDKIQVLEILMQFNLKNSYIEQAIKNTEQSPRSYTDQNSMVVHTSTTNNSLVHVTSEQAPMPMAQGTGMTSYQNTVTSPYVDPNILNYNYQDSPEGSLENQEDETDDEDEKKKKIRILLISVISVVFMFVGYNEFLAPPPKKEKSLSSDPFTTLPPNEYSLIKQSFEIAGDYYLKASYQSAYDETAKIIKKLEESGIKYQKTKFGLELLDLHNKAQTAILAIKELRDHELKLKQQREAEAKAEVVLVKCAADLEKNFKMTESEYLICIQDATEVAPNDERIANAKFLIAQRIEQAEVQKRQQADYRSGVAKLQNLYDKAVATEKRGELMQAIEDYGIVAKQKLPDPKELKGAAQRKVASIKKSIKEKSEQFIEQSNKLEQQKKYKEAIELIRKAQKVNPLDSDLEERVETLKRTLAKEIKPIWDEAVIEEEFNHVECVENKSCAIEKWKRILDMDVRDGEYYLKAFTKLKKYGAN